MFIRLATGQQVKQKEVSYPEEQIEPVDMVGKEGNRNTYINDAND